MVHNSISGISPEHESSLGWITLAAKYKARFKTNQERIIGE
jgi:hypothetical protein